MKLRGVICRLSPFGTGAIFHEPTGKAFLFTKDRVIGKNKKIAVGREVRFNLRESRIPGQPRTATDISLTDNLQGIISYLDPTGGKITNLIGEIHTGQEVYLFSFSAEDKLKLKMKVRFRLNKNGMAVLLKS